MKLELVATATFGLEAVVRREIEKLGYKILETADGRVTFLGDERAVVKSNLWLRTADRVYIKLADFKAETFEDLFQQTNAIPWEEYFPMDAKIVVVGTSVKSKLHSVPSCQSIIKKAVIKRLSCLYLTERFEETGAEYKIRFQILKDRVLILLDTSGIGLHKRGYRIADVAAPMKETLAAALVMLSFWRDDKILVDTCCGSGTIPIEAALIGRNIAPGLNRDFASMHWDFIDRDIWKEEKKKAYEEADFEKELNIKAFDIERTAIIAAKKNADEAGVLDDITFLRMDMQKFEPEGEYGVIIVNPPYGERIGDKEGISCIYTKLSNVLSDNPTWSLFMITPDKDVEMTYFGKKADRRRKLYNGRIETQFYQFHGTKPVRKEGRDE